MTSEIRSNIIKNRVGLGTVSFTNTGPVVSGIVTANTLRLPDSPSGSLGRLQIGNGLDLSLFHNGSNSFLVNNTGYLSIQSQDGVNGIFIARNAEVNLYFGPSVRLQTSSSGVTINRDLDVDGHTNLDNVSISGITTVSTGINMNASTSNLYMTDGALSYYHANNGVYLNGAGANGWLRLQAAGSSNDRTSINLNGHSASNGDSIHFRTNSTERLRIHNTGSMTASGTFAPSANNTYDLGGSSTAWRNIYAVNGTFSGNVTVDAGANTTVDVIADSAGVAMVRTGGGSGDQTTAAFELRQSTTSQQGGGISYNGDGSPAFVSGETADHTTFYRILNGTRTEVFSYPYNSNTVTFNGTVVAPAFQGNLNGTVNTASQTNITAIGQLTQLSVSGTNNPVNFTHTGQNCVTFNRNGKTLSINANYGGTNQYSNILMTSGMDIRWTLGGADRIVFKSAGHIEPQTNSQINLGSDTKRFANVYADGLELISTDSGAAAAPTLKLQRDSSSPANGDILGQIMFGGKDSTPNDEQYAMVAGKIIQAGAGGEHGAIQITTRKASAHVITANLTSTDYELLNGTNLSVDGDITGNGNFQLTSTDTGSAAAPELTLHRNSTSPADADYLGQIKFTGKHDAGSTVNYAKITGKILDASNGTEDGILEFMLRKAGSNNIAARFRSDKLQLINGTELEIADDTKLYLGNDGDLELYYQTTGTAGAYIQTGGASGNLTIKNKDAGQYVYIHGDNVHLRSTTGNEALLQAQLNGAVSLYHDNVISLSTQSEGIEVKKTASNVSSIINVESTNGGQAGIRLKTSKSGTNRATRLDYYNQDSTDPKWTLINDWPQNGNNEFSIRYANSQKIAINCTQNNMVDLYHNNTLCIRTASDGMDIWAGSDNQHANIRLRPRGTAVYSTMNFYNSAGSSEASIGTHSGANTIYYVCPTHYFHIGGAYKIQMTGSMLSPISGQSVDLGSSSLRWNNIYVNDLNLSNKGKTNDVDGTWGSYTIQEGEDDLFLINKRSGKKYKFNLTEVS